MQNYTQTGEDQWISTLPDTGRFLDVGAYDGITFSNTRGLLERGWTGVWVEPNAYAFDLAVANAPDGVELVNCLLGETTELRNFHYTRDAVSTTEEGNFDLWKTTVSFNKTYVMQLAVEDFMKSFGAPPFDFVSIDTEGTSAQILQTLRPYLSDTRMVVVEHDGKPVNLRGFHQVGETENNVILVRSVD